MKRRTFLKRTALASCIGIAPTTLLSAQPAAIDALARPELLQLLDDPNAVAAIGNAYLASFPGPYSKTQLARMLKRRLGPHPLQPLPAAIAERVKRDFATGHTCQLNGWILAETEAMQCALFSLTRV